MSIFGTYQIGQMEQKEAIETIQRITKTIKIVRDEGIQIVWKKLLIDGMVGDRRESIGITAYPIETHKNEIPIGRIYVMVNKVKTMEGESSSINDESDVHALLETLNDVLENKQRQYKTTEFYRELDERTERKLNE